MEIRKEEKWLIAILILIFAFRLFFSLQTKTFSDDSSYFNLRQIINIAKTGAPIFRDELSYSGRTFLFLPGMHYICAGLYAVFGRIASPETIFKVFMNLCASLTVLVVYLISLEISGSRKASLIAGFAAGFSPIIISETINNLGTLSMSIPANFLMLYFFMKSEKERSSVIYFLITMVFCALLDSLVLLFLMALVMYLLLVEVDNIGESSSRKELILFSIIFILWLNFIVFKDAFLAHGLSMVWKNLPTDIMARYFQKLNMLDVIYKINVIPFLAGIYVLYNYTQKERKKNIYLLTAFALSAMLLLWLKLIEFSLGLMILGVIFALLFGFFYRVLMLYIEKTKLASRKRIISYAIISLLAVSSIFNSFIYAAESVKGSVSDDEISAMDFLRENVSDEFPESAVLSSPESGTLINYFSGCRNVIDSNFFLIEQINQRYSDIREAYSTPYETAALRILDKYNADFIYLSEREEKEFGKNLLEFSGDEKCFKLVYSNPKIMIYRVLCRLSDE
ncbi:MAG: hypothetical protein NTV63_05625 [Candidatus Woesearchaeota archaeon]|nr:hypothetical protein [Candidatus Woesearchaeota archaeon]